MKIVRLLILTCISVFFGAASVLAELCSEGVRNCDNKQLCNYATHSGVGGVVWTGTPRWLSHVAEAKLRGLTCGITGVDGKTDTTALDLLRQQLAKTNAELTAAKEREADLNARLTVAVLDHNKISTVKTSKHTAELATLTEQYETERAATSKKIEGLQSQNVALETDASEAQAKVTELTNQLVESRANASASSAAKLKAEKQISQAESAASAAEQELEAAKKELAEFKIANDQTDLKQQLAAALAENEELKATGSDTVDVVEDTTQTVDPAKNVLIDIGSLTRDEQKEIQTALKEFGVYDGAIDGIMGKGSMRAIQSWQEARGYDASGELTVGQSDELLLGEEVATSAEVLAAVEAAEPEGSQSITSVMIQIARPTFDVFNCAFNLEFTNSETDGSFDVVMFADDGSGKFTATAKDIQKALVKNGLTADDNDWSQLTIEATKYDDPSVGCKPLFQRSYEIKEEGPENTFKVDSEGQLTMMGLPLASTNTSETEEVAEQVFSQSITSVIAQITNPTFDVAKCTFNLEFTNSASGKSFNVKMDPQGDTNGRFTATTNDIEDGLADAGLTAKDNDWSQLTVRVKKFDYPFVTCQPAEQTSYLISTDGAEDTFYVDRNGQLSITGLPLIPIEEAITLFGVNFDMGRAEMEEVLAGRFNCSWSTDDCVTVGGDVVNAAINKLGEIESLKFDCSGYNGCAFDKDELFAQLSQAATLLGDSSVQDDQICGAGKLGETVCATDNATLLNRSKFRNTVLNFDTTAGSEAITLLGVNFELTKTATKVVLEDRFNCTWRTDGEAEVCYTDGGDIVKLNNNKVGEIESLEFDCATYRGCTLSADETWEYLDQSQSLTALQINTIPFDETYWLKLGHYVNLEGLQSVKNRVRGAVTANVFKKLEILDTGDASWTHHLSLGPFSSSEEVQTFIEQNTNDIARIENASQYPNFSVLTGENYPTIVRDGKNLQFNSCSFGSWEHSVCHKGARYKCGAANSGEVVCALDSGISMHRDKFSNIDFESTTGGEAVTIFGVNFDMNKAEIEEVLAGRFNCTWTDGGCATVAGGDVVNSTINKLGEVESLTFDCDAYWGCNFSKKETVDALFQSVPLESTKDSSCGAGTLGETICVADGSVLLERKKFRNTVIKFN